MDMTGKTVLITGASRGIGEAAARIFAEAGARVALLARNRERIAQVAGEIGDQALAIPCDVSRYWEVATAVEKVVADSGSLDAVVANAGVIEPIARIDEADPEAWDKLIDINIKGVFHLMRAALPVMGAQGSGTFITISSGAAYRPLEGWSAYCSSKAGAYMLTQAAHLENHDRGVRVLGLSPGTVATEMQREIKASGVNPVSQLDWSEHIPPEWPARALLWMCGSEADPWLGDDVSLRDEEIRGKVGLT